MTTTRKSDTVFLVGVRDLDPLTSLIKLPTIRQVFLRFHHYLNEVNLIRNASQLTVDELLIVWNKAAIPTRLKKHCQDKLEKIHSDWCLLKKNKHRNSPAQRKREIEFTKELDKLFDVSHSDAFTLIKISEDWEFLQDQRGPRKMVMSTVDKELAEKNERALQRTLAEENRRNRHALSIQPSCSTATEIEDLASNTSSSDNDDEFQPKSLTKKAKMSPQEQASSTTVLDVLSQHVTSALDRNKVSDREAVKIIVPVAAALGYDPACLAISRNTISRKRKEARRQYADSIVGTFQPQCPLVVHWDGKILPNIFGSGKVDRLPVLVSGDGNEKLLGVPKLTAGTGENEADAVHSLLEKWNITESVQAMSFDTTSVNTGINKGACILLERMIGRELLWLACRHHMLEIILSKVFTLCFGPSSSPDIPLFKRFKVVWDNIDRDNFQSLPPDSAIGDFLDPMLIWLNQYANEKSSQLNMRDDYMELIELTMLIFQITPSKMHWRAPGPIHHARWMAKLLYTMKIFLFRGQNDIFKLTKRELAQLERFVKFGALFYTRAWTHAALATEAATSDLHLWSNLEKYSSVDPEVSKCAKQVLQRHLWYLSDELVGLALFSDTVSDQDKEKIVKGMTKSTPSTRSVRGNSSLLKKGVTLGDFASTRTGRLFNLLMIDDSFLSLPPQKWKEEQSYKKGKERVSQLRVVNDTAERGVKLFDEYNKLLTHDEEDKQFLLQVVEANRKMIPTSATKRAIVEAVSK